MTREEAWRAEVRSANLAAILGFGGLLAIAGGHSLIDANTAFDLIDSIAIGFGLYVAYLAVRATVKARRLLQELRALDR